jgi:anthranilate phosphoribosyltransferase
VDAAQSYPKPADDAGAEPAAARSTPMDDSDTRADLAALTSRLRAGRHGAEEEVRRLVAAVLAGAGDLDAFGAWLLALADAGESADEIAGVVTAIRGQMVPVPRPADLVVADTCGTGGDGSASFNISTAVALVVAAAGQPVAKHGNRAVSSRTGSADVLEQLGLPIDAGPAASAASLARLGFCFCLAPLHHPALARVGPLRRSLGRPTVFNLVGPLCNPAGATVQLIGVGRESAREPLAEAARRLGARRTLVVSGRLGVETDARCFDEVSLFGPTDVIEVGPAATHRYRWSAEDFGLVTRPVADLALLAVDGPAASAARIRSVLAGDAGPARDVVVLNAAAVLWAADRAPDLIAARLRAEQAIDSGAAARLLEQLRHAATSA